MPTYSIVIRCFNEEKHIGLLLDWLGKQTLPNVEIVVVDSGSTDGTLNIARRYPVKLVHIPSAEFTFGKALNLGIRHASGDLVAIASAHVYPTDKYWLEKLFQPFENPNIALTFGRQIGNDKTKFSEHQIFRKWFPDEPHGYEQDHPFCNNANAAIRRSVWEKLPYDETITGLEDLDWAKRALANGYKLAYVPDAVIVHVHEETPQRILNRYRREAIAYRRIFPEAHFSLYDLCYLILSNIVSDYIYAFKQGRFWGNITEIPVFRIMQFWGTYKGYRQKGEVSSMLKKRFYYPNKVKFS
jgi:glycosyltransferase involved in cell wall biosynthesis